VNSLALFLKRVQLAYLHRNCLRETSPNKQRTALSVTAQQVANKRICKWFGDLRTADSEDRKDSLSGVKRNALTPARASAPGTFPSLCHISVQEHNMKITGEQQVNMWATVKAWAGAKCRAYRSRRAWARALYELCNRGAPMCPSPAETPPCCMPPY
jgi:hypothetical protein